MSCGVSKFSTRLLDESRSKFDLWRYKFTFLKIISVPRMLHLIRLPLPQSSVCRQPRAYSHPSHFPPRSFSLRPHFIIPYFILLSSIRISSIPPSRPHSLLIWNQTSKANRRAPISVYLHHFSIVEYLGFCDHDLYSWAFSKKKCSNTLLNQLFYLI